MTPRTQCREYWFFFVAAHVFVICYMMHAQLPLVVNLRFATYYTPSTKNSRTRSLKSSLNLGQYGSNDIPPFQCGFFHQPEVLDGQFAFFPLSLLIAYVLAFSPIPLPCADVPAVSPAFLVYGGFLATSLHTWKRNYIWCYLNN